LRRDEQVVERLQGALDLQTLQKGGAVERRAAPTFERRPRRPYAVKLFNVAKRRARLGQQQPGHARRSAMPKPVALDQYDLDAGDRARIRRQAPGKAAADNHHLGSLRPAKTGVFRPARGGKLVDPGRDAVVSSHAGSRHEMQDAKFKMQTLKILHAGRCLHFAS
jgi:hypothetical protein